MQDLRRFWICAEATLTNPRGRLGVQLDFEEFEVDELDIQADFGGMDEMLSMLGDI